MKHQGKSLDTEAICFVYICEIQGFPSRGGGVASMNKVLITLSFPETNSHVKLRGIELWF